MLGPTIWISWVVKLRIKVWEALWSYSVPLCQHSPSTPFLQTGWPSSPSPICGNTRLPPRLSSGYPPASTSEVNKKRQTSETPLVVWEWQKLYYKMMGRGRWKDYSINKWETQVANKHMEKVLSWLDIKERQVKTSRGILFVAYEK